MKVKWLLLPLFGLQVTACISPSPTPHHYEHDLARNIVKSDELIVASKEELEEAEKEDEEKIYEELEFADFEQKKAVQRWIRYFTHNDRERFTRFLERGLPYKPIIETILQKQEVPTYFYYLALIESGFQLRATSRAQAVGMWQFIGATGKRYGLKINNFIDERQDPFRATIAAANYLKDLYNVFQSWFLAMSAYNAGEYRIMTTIMGKGSRDFWHLAKIKALPRETRNYIPKFIAAALIGSNPEKYGFHLTQQSPIPALSSIVVPSPLKLDQIADTLQIPLRTLKQYNPNLLREVTNPYQKTYRIWVPKRATTNLAALSQLQPISRDKLLGRGYRYYRIRRGDSLASIAHKFKTNIRTLKRLNHMRSSRIYAGHRLKVPADGGYNHVKKYRVRRGDSLSRVARRFGMSVKSLKKLNSIRSTRIYVGQVLKVAPNQG